jgi:phenylacetate-CoA ligase
MTPNELLERFYEMCMASQFWSVDQLRAYQATQLEQLLRHARATTPYYEKRLRPVFRPDGKVDLRNFHLIPIVPRADMVAHRDAMQARELPPGHGPTGTISTSGSTGLAITVTTNGLCRIANDATRFRMQGWQKVDWARVVLDRMGPGGAEAIAAPPQELGTWGAPWLQRSATGRMYQVSRYLDTGPLLDWFERLGASYLVSGPNMAHVIALDAARIGRKTPIDTVLAQGNVVHDADRHAVADQFGARIVEVYSSKEGGHMAHLCPEGRLHVNMETVLVEVLDADNRPCEPGKTGRVVITPFYQTGQPLIRYEQGDWASWGGPCPCGRHSMVLEKVSGRSVPIFTHPVERANAHLMPEQTTELLGASYWQLAQVGALDYEMRYVRKDGAVAPDTALITAMFNTTYFADARLAFREMDRIPLTAGGKLVEYVNEYKKG